MTTEEIAFRRAIAAAPGEDAVRLVYADWLDENARPERAEYIRAAVRLEPLRSEGHGGSATRACPVIDFIRNSPRPGGHMMPTCERCNDAHELEHACGRLLAAHEAAWRKAPPCRWCHEPDGTRSHSACAACHGTGDAGGLMEERAGGYTVGVGSRSVDFKHKVEWSRGFPGAVHCRLEECLERAHGNKRGEMDSVTWRPTAWARAVCQWWPVTRFVAADARPWELDSVNRAWWDADGPQRSPSLLPRPLYRELDCDYESFGGKCYRSHEAATDALATALARLARRAGSA